jgi:hypothetical protein
MVIDRKINIEINYNHLAFNEESIEWFKTNLESNLNLLIEHIKKNKDDVYFTPSDFDAVDLDEEDLKVLFD